MLNRLLPFTILVLSASAVWAQTPQAVTFQHGGQLGNSGQSLMACQDQFAGTIEFDNFVGNSNDTDLDTIYLCFGDEIDIVHNGDADLTGDPNNFTVPGVTYGFYDCPPTISGPNLTTILGDPCLTDDPPPLNNIWVTAGGNFNGNQELNNGGGLQNTFNMGDPLLIWFAPITIDNFAIKQYEVDPMTNEIGPCVHVNIDEAFAVVYLNALEISNFNIVGGSSGCGGQIDISGGLPEFDGSTYPDITISLVGNPSVTGTVTNGPVGHGGTIEFTVPTPGFYTITVEDGKSCPITFNADMSSCVSVAQSIQSLSAAPGDLICVNVTHENGFTDIVSMQYGVTWDPSILQFSSIENLTPNLPNFTVPTSFNVVNDTLIFAWASFAGTGVTLPPGEVIYQICFDVIGVDGDCSDIEFVVPQGSSIEVVNENGAVLGFNGIDGQVCVSNSALVVDFTQDSVTCYGGNDGSFTVTVSGGSPPYGVSWQGINSGSSGGPGTINIDGGSFTATGLEADVYSVTITDSQGTPLTVIENVEVLGPPIIDLQLVPSPGLCNGDLGSINSTLIIDSNIVANPLLTYDYLWSTNATGTSINNLNPDFYSLTITEISTGCTVSNTIFLPQPPPLSAAITIDSATCSGVSDGEISVVVSGGTPDPNGDYLIELPTAGVGVTVTGTVTNVQGIPANTYPLIVTDGNGCVLQQDIVLPSIKVLSIVADIDQILCDSACSGGIFITGLSDGGNTALPFNFDWFGQPPPPPPVFTSGTQSQLSNLCEGTYWVVMEDLEGCEVIDTFVVSEPDPIDLSILDVQDESCDPGMDGSITIGVAGGAWPYTYTWNNPSTDSIATGLAAGMYTVIVEDDNMCTDTISATVTAPTPPEILNFPNDTLDCINSNDGSLTVFTTPDVINFDWSNGGTTQTVFGLTPGEYIVTVSNNAGCIDTDTALVVAPEQLVLDSIQFESPQCPGLGGGSVRVFVSGGTAPYNFVWSNGFMGQGVAVVQGATITAGDYSVTVTDANGCQPPLVINTTLEDPPGIVVDFSNIDSVSCAMGLNCDGGATATAMYSDGSNGLFDFQWFPSQEFTNDAVSSTAFLLCPGTDSVQVSDGVCADTFFVEIPAPPSLGVMVELENVTCNGFTDGSAELTPTGGTPSYTVEWPDGSTEFNIENLAPGDYIATISDANDCQLPITVQITEPLPLVVSVEPSGTFDISCNGYDDGIITVLAEGGNVAIDPDAVTYLWANGIAATDSPVATELSAGTYSVTVVDIKGCTDSLSLSLVEPPPIEFQLGEIPEVNCFGQTTTVTVDSIWGGAPSTFGFSVNGSFPFVLVGEQIPVFAGEVNVVVADLANTECKVEETFFISQPDELSIQLPEIVEIELGDTTTMLIPTIVPPIPIDSFIWEPSEGLSCADCKNPTVNITSNQTYTLTIFDINGCSASESIFIDIDRNRNVFIPNIFSPNGDGINDKFKIFTGQGVSQINFVKIYDRWGELVFEEPAIPLSPNLDGTPGWDGRFNGDKMNPAVFLYLVEVEFVDGKVLLYRGDVTLVR